jgi:beta-lactam-binding protein with PASTA domain
VVTAHDRRSEAAEDILMLGSTGAIVPDLIGLSLEQACEAAAWAGTKLNATGAKGHGRVGVVVAQSPSPGVSTEPLRQIYVSVSAPWLPDGSTKA